MRDHGGNIDSAIRIHGGAEGDWVDLSTGINRVAYPVPRLSAAAWTQLPTRSAMGRLIRAASGAYGTDAAILPVAGAQAAIQMIPRLTAPVDAAVLSPTYNEHAACLRSAGWRVREGARLSDLEGATLAIVVNPNNPDGQRFSPADLVALSGKVGRLVVDESFADPRPDLSVAPDAGRNGLLVLRSFGKFYGLAGLRLGFVLGAEPDIEALAAMAGPWPVSGAAIEVGSAALCDSGWARTTIERLDADCALMDTLATRRGWTLIGGTELFRLYDTDDAAEAQNHLARCHIWSRIFPWSARAIRLGLPAPAEWDRVRAAMEAAL